MGWSNDQFDGELTIPTGATTGARVTINVGQDGAIKVYDASNVLICEISSGVDGVKVYGAPGQVTAEDVSGDTASLVSAAPSYVDDPTSPGLLLRKSTETGDGASITEYDDTFFRGMLLLSPSPVSGGSGGEDFSYIQMDGRFADDPIIQLFANGPNSFISFNANTILNADGTMTSYGLIDTYTPELTNDGAATYSNRSGWFIRLGAYIFFNAYFVGVNAGSGAGNLGLTAPTDIDRTTRQVIFGHAETMSAGNAGSVAAVALTSGSGDTFDRVRNSTGTNIQGADIQAGAILAFQGWYREL